MLKRPTKGAEEERFLKVVESEWPLELIVLGINMMGTYESTDRELQVQYDGSALDESA